MQHRVVYRLCGPAASSSLGHGLQRAAGRRRPLGGIPALARFESVSAAGGRPTHITPRLAQQRAAKAARLQAEEEANRPGLFRRHVLPLALWTFASISGGVYMLNNDPSVGLAESFTSTMNLLKLDDEKLTEETLEGLARATATNDTAKRLFLDSPEHFLKLLDLVTSGKSVTSRQHAAKCIENITLAPDCGKKVLESGLHEQIIGTVAGKKRSLFVVKTLTSAVANLVGPDEEKNWQLVEAGAIQLFQAVNSHKVLQREKFKIALERLCATAVTRPERLATLGLDGEELQQVQELGWQALKAAESPWHAMRNTIIESGVLLYFHTAVGGAVWGAIESFRKGEAARAVLRNSLRTSIVTSLVPIYSVGAVVSTFNYLRRRMDKDEEKFAFYSLAGLSAYPLYRVLPIVESYAPNWLGGHIVGFVSFFLYMLVTENDLLKNDMELKQRDLKQQQKLQVHSSA